MTIRDAAVLVGATLALAGCGGAPAVTGVPRAATEVQIALSLPHVSASMLRRATFIAPSVKSGAFTVNGGAPVIASLVAGAPNCATTPTGLTCSVMLSAPAGSDTFGVSLYDAANATGALLGTGSATAILAPGTVTSVGITVGGVVASVILALGSTTPVTGTPASTPLTVTATDADGNIIIADPYATPITLTDSDTSGTTQLSTTTVASPSQTVNVIYNGSPLVNATFSATVVGATPVVQAAVLTPKTESTIDWSTFGFNAQRTSYNPNETVCCSSQPVQLWSHRLSPREYLTTEPIFANNIFTSLIAGGAYVDFVYVGDNHGNLYAFNAANGNIVWQKTLGSQATGCTDMPDKIFGITGTLLFDRTGNRLYVVDGLGKLYALDPATGNVAAGWPSGGLLVVTNSTLDHVYGGLNLDTVHGIMPVPTASYCDSGRWTGALRFVNVSTASVVNTFIFALPEPANWGSGMWGMGGTSLDPVTEDIYGASGNAEPNEVWPYSDSVIHWAAGTYAVDATSESSNNVGDDDFGAIPSLFPAADGTQCAGVEGKSGILYMYKSATIGSGATSQPQLGLANSDDYNSATPSYSPSTGKIYITTGYPGGAHPPGVYAFTVQAGCTLPSTPDWSFTVAGTNILSPTTVANGEVFVGDGTQVYAFNAASGTKLWQVSDGTSNTYAGITVVNGMLLTANWDGTISAFVPAGNVGPVSRARR